MNAQSRERFQRTAVETRREKYREADRRKRLLASTILARIDDELAAQPATEQFTYPLEPQGGLGRLERFVLSHYPDDIAMRVGHDRPVTLDYDNSVEPPLLTVHLGEPTAKGGNQ